MPSTTIPGRQIYSLNIDNKKCKEYRQEFLDKSENCPYYQATKVQ